MSKAFSDRWRVTESLPEGGQAYVYKVVDAKGAASTTYILKRLKNLGRIDRFKKEYETLRKLQSRGIVQVIDFDFDSSTPFFVTEFCERGNLAQQEELLRASVFQKIQVFLEVCRGLQMAHDNGITHRDIKPDNVLVRSDRSVALADFGLCHDQEGELRLTASSEAVGSRHFMAPEFEDGRAEDVTPAGDIYSLGKMLYWLLSGGRIFAREKFRDARYDLRTNAFAGNWGQNDLMEQFNLVFDRMITVRPQDRIPIKNVLQQVQRAEQLFALEYALPTGAENGSLCRHCGTGFYAPCRDSPHNFGIEQKGMPTLRIRVCNSCGHVALFRPDHTSR